MTNLSIQEIDENKYDEEYMREIIKEQKKFIASLKNTIRIYAPYTKFPDE